MQPENETSDEYVYELLNILPEREGNIVIHRIGLLGHSAKTYVKIGKMFKISGERARVIFYRAMSKCSHIKRRELLDHKDNYKIRLSAEQHYPGLFKDDIISMF